MIALMQSTLPYLDADELFRLVPLTDALDCVAHLFRGRALARRSSALHRRRRRVLGDARCRRATPPA